MKGKRILFWITILVCGLLLSYIYSKRVDAADSVAFSMKYHEKDGTSVVYTQTGCANGSTNKFKPIADFGWKEEGRFFLGWKLYRESDQTYFMQNSTGGMAWKALEAGNTLPEGWTFKLFSNGGSVNSPANRENDVIHLYGQWIDPAGFTVVYHEDNNATGTTGAYIPYANVDGIKTKTIQELGYSTANRSFMGWRIYRETDGKWLIKEGNNVYWAALVNGQLPSGCEFQTNGNGTVLKTPATSGKVHLYAQWVENGFTVRYYLNENSSPSTTTTSVTYGVPTNTETAASLGFSVSGKVMLGWKVKWETENKWLVEDTGNPIWVTAGNTSGKTFYIHNEGKPLSTTVEHGIVGLYAVWIDKDNIDVTSSTFGANGSDRLDDRAAIQKALNLGQKSSENITVCIPAGTYYLSAPLIIYSDTTLILDNNATLRLQDGVDLMIMNGSISGDKPGGYLRSKNITISGGTWDGNGSSGAYATNLIYIIHANNVSISNVNMINCCANHFIEFVGVNEGSITNSSFSDFYLANTDSFETYLTTVDGYYEYNPNAAGSVTSEAIQLDYAGEDNSSGSAPFDLTPCKNITIDGCTFENCLSGIGNHHNESEAENITLTNNTFTNMSNTCFNITSMKEATISNNTAVNVRRFAYVTAASNGVTFEDNNASGKTLSGGITIDNAAADITVKNNSLSGFTKCVFAEDAQILKIENNVLKQAGDTGLYFRNVNNSTILGNEVKNCLNNAINISNSECEVKGNTIDAIEKNGIYVAGIQGNIENNKILNCKRLNIVARDLESSGTTVASRGVILNNRYDLRYGVKVSGSITRGANYYPADAAEPSIPTTFLIYYHLDDDSVASTTVTEIVYGTPTKYKTISELGFSVAGKGFIGWKAYRSDDNAWRVTNGSTLSWAETLPAGSTYSLYSDGGSLSTTVPAGGELHFYAQWEDNGYGTKKIVSATAKYDTIAKTAAQEFTVVTSSDVQYLMLYAEGGKPLVNSWAAAGNSVAGANQTRIWNVSHSIASTGSRQLVFKGGTAGATPVTNAVTVPFTVINTGIISATAKYDGIIKGSSQVFTIKTTSDATVLVEYAEDGKTLVKTWNASGNSTVSGSTRTWTVSQNIGTAGNRNLIFKAGTSSTPTAAKRAVPFVVATSGVIEVKVKEAVIGKGGTQTFTVKTTSGDKNLMIYAEGGNLVKSYAASSSNSTVSGNVRTWTVSLAIGSAGNRELVIKSGAGTTPTGATKKAAFAVADKRVISAAAKYSTIAKTGAQQFTVVTTADVQYLMLYAEGGKTLVNSWAASGNSVVSDAKTRIWTVSHSIGTTGSRNLVFKGGTTNTTAVTNAVTVPFTVISTGVISASGKYDSIPKGTAQVFTIKTTSDATVLMEYAEDGKTLVKTWNASGNSTVSGNVRTWTVTQNIGTAGDRNLIFKAGTSSTPTAAQREVPFKVVNTGVISASVKYATIVKTSSQQFTVKTTADVKYLMLYSEDGKTLVKSWAADGNSTVSGNIRTWTVNHSIGTTGDRSLIFKGGTTGTTPVTNGVTASFKVVDSGVLTASAKNATMNKGTTQTFTVTTTADCNYLAEYAEGGNLVTTWTANSSNSKVSGNVRTWTVTQTIGSAGNRTLTFKAGKNSAVTAAERNVSFTVK